MQFSLSFSTYDFVLNAFRSGCIQWGRVEIIIWFTRPTGGKNRRHVSRSEFDRICLGAHAVASAKNWLQVGVVNWFKY